MFTIFIVPVFVAGRKPSWKKENVQVRVTPANAVCGTIVIVGKVKLTQAGIPANVTGLADMKVVHSAGMFGNGTRFNGERL